MNLKDDYIEWRDKTAYEIFEAEFPNTSRKPSGKKWTYENSSSLRIARNACDAATERCEVEYNPVKFHPPICAECLRHQHGKKKRARASQP